MKYLTFLLVVNGLFHLLMFVLGAFNVIDYSVCIKGAGECNAQSTLHH